MTFPTDIQVAKKLLQLNNSARDRNKPFNLNLTSVRNLLKAKRCYYTNVALHEGNRTIDRVDNDKGYVVGNVVACTEEFNKLKKNLTVGQISAMFTGLKKKVVVK